MTKTFDGSFGACPRVNGATILLREENKRLLTHLTKEQLVDRISISTEQLRELERKNQRKRYLENHEKLPSDKHARRLLSKQRGRPPRKK